MNRSEPGPLTAYDRSMGRSLIVGVACCVAFAGSAGITHAAPGPPPPPCSFALSAPVRDGDTVAATVQSTGCAALAVPYSSVACLQPADGPGMVCATGRGADPARVSVPLLPGVAYLATGRGCAGWVGLPPAPNCQLLGPISATP